MYQSLEIGLWAEKKKLRNGTNLHTPYTNWPTNRNQIADEKQCNMVECNCVFHNVVSSWSSLKLAASSKNTYGSRALENVNVSR